MEELQEGLPGAAGDATREALREAERNMGAARDELRDDDTPGALDRQADAIDELREGMRQMGEDLRRAESQLIPMRIASTTATLATASEPKRVSRPENERTTSRHWLRM